MAQTNANKDMHLCQQSFAQALPFAAKAEHELLGQCARVPVVPAAHSAQEREARELEFVASAKAVFAKRKGRVQSRAAARADCALEREALDCGQQNRLEAQRIGAAKHSTDVVRVGNALEQQEPRVALELGKLGGLGWLDAEQESLMVAALAKRLRLFGIDTICRQLQLRKLREYSGFDVFGK